MLGSNKKNGPVKLIIPAGTKSIDDFYAKIKELVYLKNQFGK